jgi:type VII secretion integral membrane protein EccD
MTMTAAGRRVTVVTPRTRVDVVLPLQSTFAELVPQLVRLTGAETTTPHEDTGWVLTKLGGVVIPPGLTVTGAGIRDGDVLYLGPRERHATPLLFDDVVDAIASAAENRRGAWGPRTASRVGLAAAITVLVGVTLLLVAGFSGEVWAPITCGVLALGLLFGGAALTRAYGDGPAGSACAISGISAALLAGLTALPPFRAWPLELDSAAVGLVVVTVYGVLATALIASKLALFIAVIVTAGLSSIAAAVVLLAEVPLLHAAAVVIPIVTALPAVAPMLALRIGKLPLPRVPSDMDSFRADERPTVGQQVLDQTSTAEDILGGLLSAFGIIAFASVFFLVQDGDGWAAALSAVAATVWMLRSRSYAGTAQRIVLMVSGLAMTVLLGIWLAVTADRSVVFGAAALLTLAATVCLVYATRVVRGRQSPYLSRLMDIAEFLGLMALIPLTGAIIGVYDAIRGAVG